MAYCHSFNICIVILICLANGYWQPEPGTTWQWQINDGDISEIYDVDMYDVDLFDVTAETITSLHSQGRIVICYFSAGTFEEGRPDSDDFPDSVKGNVLVDWPDEQWLDIREWGTLGPIMIARLELAVSKGCDGVEPDNVDGYDNDNGFSLTYDDQITYNKYLAAEAHDLDLAIGLKNDLDQIEELVGFFDFAVNEQCNEFDECDKLLTFTNNNKAVFGVEYEMEVTDFCDNTNAMNFDFLAKNWDLDECVYACRDYPCESTPTCLTTIPAQYTGTGGTCYDYSGNDTSTDASSDSDSDSGDVDSSSDDYMAAALFEENKQLDNNNNNNNDGSTNTTSVISLDFSHETLMNIWVLFGVFMIIYIITCCMCNKRTRGGAKILEESSSVNT